jgi:hypothetical protein
VLVDRIAVPCEDTLRWAQWFEDTEGRRVGYTTIGRLSVSTICLGLNHNFGGWGDRRPILFETMIAFDQGGNRPAGTSKWSDLQLRCSTWLEAEAQHARVVSQVHREHYPERYEPEEMWDERGRPEEVRGADIRYPRPRRGHA